ncbi:hypothetical protein N9933_01030 [bacterium]|nr:hypothetical protein [bacterium]
MNKSSTPSLSLGTFLFLIFLVLKLTNYIDWSWWWVTSPLWISLLLSLFFVLIIAIATIKWKQ